MPHSQVAEIPETVSSTDGVTLRLYDLGGSGDLLLMAHATGFCGQVWQPMAETLRAGSADHPGYRCIAFDFRAHGRSTRPIGRGLEWQGMAEDLLAVADAVSPGHPVAAVGHSMGGASLVLAETTRPGTLSMGWTFEPILFGTRHLVPGSGVPGSGVPGSGVSDGELPDDKLPDGELPGSDPSEISQAARRRRATFANRDEVMERYGAKPPLSILDRRALQAYADNGFEDLEDGAVTLRCRPEDEAAVFDNHNSGARERVGELTIPFLIAAGGDGRPPAQAVLAAAEEFPNLDLREYEDLSHFGPLEAPERLGRDCLAWMTARGHTNGVGEDPVV